MPRIGTMVDSMQHNTGLGYSRWQQMGQWISVRWQPPSAVQITQNAKIVHYKVHYVTCRQTYARHAPVDTFITRIMETAQYPFLSIMQAQELMELGHYPGTKQHWNLNRLYLILHYLMLVMWMLPILQTILQVEELLHGMPRR